MERELVLLGLLSEDELYGYQINEMIETYLGTSINLTKPTAYRILHQFAENGLITFREEKEGNRPTRRVYKITRSGRDHFKDLLRQSLSDSKPMENASALSLAFLNEISSREAKSLLEDRRARLSSMLDSFFEDDTQYGNFELVVENRILHLSAELEWIKDVIQRI
jgi:DNA-binding PadR family transcriptional regulator